MQYTYRLVDQPIDRFDPEICRQHLQECLKKVLRCYDAINESIQKKCDDMRTALIHRELMESLYLLLNLGSSEALGRSLRIPSQFKYFSKI